MLESEIYKRVSNELGIPLEKVVEYDKVHWRQVKLDLNNPTFDVLEIPLLGSWTMTPLKLYKSLKFSLNLLKRMKKRLKKTPNNSKLVRDFTSQSELFKNLWNLKNETKLFENGFNKVIRNEFRKRANQCSKTGDEKSSQSNTGES